MDHSKLKKTEEALGYKFSNNELLVQALSHPSCFDRNGSKLESYERLEFLGDSILGSYVARVIFKQFPNCSEGDLTRIKIALVCGSNLTEVGKRLGLDKLIEFGVSEVKTGMRGLDSAVEDVVEACIAAIYVDGGIDAAHKFIQREIIDKSEALEGFCTGKNSSTNSSDIKANIKQLENPKSILQMRAQKNKKTPKYTIINEFGPSHDKEFEAQVSIDGLVIGKACGKTKKEAETNAAQKALKGYHERS